MISAPLDARPLSELPPRLDVLSELSRDQELRRSSTFRACLEKAVEDINIKYGASAPCLPDPGHAIDDVPGDATPGGRRASHYHTRSNFQPRYRLPHFVHVPMTRVQPAVGEVKDAPPGASFKPGKPAARLSDFHIDEILSKALVAPDSPKGSTSSENKESVAGLRCDDASIASSLSPTMPPKPPFSQHKSEDPNVSSDAPHVAKTNGETESSVSPPVDAECTLPNTGALPGAFPTTVDDGPPNSPSDVDDDVPGGACSQDAENRADQKIEEPSHPLAVASKRVGSTPVDLEAQLEPQAASLDCPETLVLGISKPANNGAYTASGRQRAPSVSELVSKFRRMASPPDIFDGSGSRGECEMRVPSGPALGTWHGRLSQDFDDDSTLRSASGDSGPGIHHAKLTRRRVVTPSTDESGFESLRRVQNDF